jgi:hypothetical protein
LTPSRFKDILIIHNPSRESFEEKFAEIKEIIEQNPNIGLIVYYSGYGFCIDG